MENFVFSSTSAVYGAPETVPVTEDTPLNPMSPYGASKAMTERMLTDSDAAYGLRSVVLRYFNVAGADPEGRAGQSTRGATHLLKVALEAATGRREHVAVFGTDYDTPDGTGIRDYIHVSDLVGAHAAALDHLRGGGESLLLNCGYGHGYSVLELLDAVQRVSADARYPRPRAPCRRRAGDDRRCRSDPARRSPGRRASTTSIHRRARALLGRAAAEEARGLGVALPFVLISGWPSQLASKRGLVFRLKSILAYPKPNCRFAQSG